MKDELAAKNRKGIFVYRNVEMETNHNAKEDDSCYNTIHPLDTERCAKRQYSSMLCGMRPALLIHICRIVILIVGIETFQFKLLCISYSAIDSSVAVRMAIG